MKYYIIGGEASGDLHGSNLIKHLHLQDAEATITCWGGNLMQEAGANLVKHYKELAFMGFIEVVKNLPTILSNLKKCKQDIEAFNPDVLVLIDYPGFNLRIAKWAKQQGFKVVYYISPQVWAWKENRVHSMKKCIDRLICILPFEKAYYEKKWNWNVDYVGHPLIDVIENFKAAEPNNTSSISSKKTIAILPGSRKQEIAKKLPIMLKVSQLLPNYQFVIAQAPGQDDEFYQPFLQPYKNVSITNKTYSLLQQAQAALVTSGTATLETALFNVPEAVCYKASPISYAIGKRLIKIKFIALVNLIMDKLVVKEFIQQELTPENLANELDGLLNNVNYRNRVLEDYTLLYQKLQTGASASQKAAEIVVEEGEKRAKAPN